jgi:hypothetical protein
MTTTETTEGAVAIATPHDVDGIAAMIRDGSEGVRDADDRDLLDRLRDQLGEDEAWRLWRAASTEVEHEARVEEETQDFGTVLLELQAAVQHASASLEALRSGDAWNCEYAEGHPGRDLAALLERIGLDVRCAIAINPVKPKPADLADDVPDEDAFYDGAPADEVAEALERVIAFMQDCDTVATTATLCTELALKKSTVLQALVQGLQAGTVVHVSHGNWCLPGRALPEPQHAEHVESDAERGICRRCGVSIHDGYCTNPETEQ